MIGQKLRFRKGDIIFGKRRAYQRKLAVAEFDGICSAHAMVIRAKAEAVLPGFLPFLMRSDMFMERAMAISVGSLSPTINWTTLKVQEFALPPTAEQRRLADIFWAANEVLRLHIKGSQSAHAARIAGHKDLLTKGFHTRGLTKSETGLLPASWRSCPSEGCVRDRQLPPQADQCGWRSHMQGPYPYYGPTGVLDHLNEGTGLRGDMP